MQPRQSMTRVPDSDNIRAAAQQWFARLMAPDCNAAERTAFELWRAADPANSAAYREVENVWDFSATLRNDPSIAAALQVALIPAPPARAPTRRWWPVLAMAASVLVAVVVYRQSIAPEIVAPVRYATALGKQRTLVLDDGSKVVLDTATELQVQYGKHARRLTLLRGQADFQVQHNSARPFVVNTATGAITATGTKFQVRVDGGISTVTLLEGQVLVASQMGEETKTATLAPNERLAIDAAGKLGPRQQVPEAELASALGWLKGELVVKEWPLQAVVAEMNRYSNTKLRIEDASLRDVPISGVFKAGDQQSFALSLEYGWPIRVDQRDADGEIVLHTK